MANLIGYDYYGLAHELWPMPATIKNTPAGAAIGVLDNVFGDPVPNLKLLLAEKNDDGTPKYPSYRIQIYYTESHRLVPLSYLVSRCRVYEKLAKAHSDVKFYLSHTVEYKESSLAEVNKRVKAIQTFAPHCTPVNNPWQGPYTKNILVETHDVSQKWSGQKPYIVSTDGSTITHLNADEFNVRFSNAEIRFLWASRFNLRNQQVPQPAPEDRTAAPTPDYLRAIVRLASPSNIELAPKPTFSARFIPIEEPLLWKSFCEDFANPDLRTLKPLLLCPSTAPLLSIVTYQGKEVCKIKFFGNYPPNLHRYYTGLVTTMWGYEIAEKAFRMSGSECVWIKDGRTCYGPVNPAFRKGYYRVFGRDE